MALKGKTKKAALWVVGLPILLNACGMIEAGSSCDQARDFAQNYHGQSVDHLLVALDEQRNGLENVSYQITNSTPVRASKRPQLILQIENPKQYSATGYQDARLVGAYCLQ